MSENIFENNTEETPDLNFDVETPDITFDNIENGTPINVVSMDRHDEEDIDDLDEPDQYVDTVEENGDCEEENNADAGATSRNNKVPDNRLLRLPLARVKHIIKLDPDVSIISQETTMLITKATELFIESLAREAFVHTAQAKKKTVQKRDVDAAISSVDALLFLEGAMGF